MVNDEGRRGKDKMEHEMRRYIGETVGDREEGHGSKYKTPLSGYKKMGR